MAVDHPDVTASHSMITARWAVITMAMIFFIASWYKSERPLVLVAVPLLLWLFIRGIRKPTPQPGVQIIVVAASALLVYDMFNPRLIGQGQPDLDIVDNYARLSNALWVATGAALLTLYRKHRQLGRVWTAAILAMSGLIGAATIAVTPAPGIDVWHLHREAGEALFEGQNPYADIDVLASSMATADSRLIVGYPYTPLNLATFGTSAVVAGDSRWISLVCWLAFLGIFSTLRSRTATTTAMLFFVASQPAWQLVLEISYTESVTLLCLAGGLAAWRNRKWLGPVLLGAALATKQYLVVLAPLIGGARLLTVRSRIVTFVSAAALVSVGIAWGASEYLDSVVFYHLRVPPQGHSTSLYGMVFLFGGSWVPPTALGLSASVVIGLVSARTARTASQLLIGAATALGVGFFLATQAFANYWFLVGVLLALALLLAEPESSSSSSGARAESSMEATVTSANR